MQDPLEAYVIKILKAKGIPESGETKASLLKEINDAIDQALIEALPLKQLDKLEAAAKSNNVSSDLVEQLLIEVGIEPDRIIEKTLQNFQNKYLKGEK